MCELGAGQFGASGTRRQLDGCVQVPGQRGRTDWVTGGWGHPGWEEGTCLLARVQRELAHCSRSFRLEVQPGRLGTHTSRSTGRGGAGLLLRATMSQVQRAALSGTWAWATISSQEVAQSRLEPCRGWGRGCPGHGCGWRKSASSGLRGGSGNGGAARTGDLEQGLPSEQKEWGAWPGILSVAPWGGLVPQGSPPPAGGLSRSGTPWGAPSPPAEGSLTSQRKGKGSGLGQRQPQGWGPGVKNRPGSGVPSLEGHPKLKLHYPQGLCSLWATPPRGGEQCCAQGGVLTWGLSACNPPGLSFLICEMGPPAPAQDGCGAPGVEAAGMRVFAVPQTTSPATQGRARWP